VFLTASFRALALCAIAVQASGCTPAAYSAPASDARLEAVARAHGGAGPWAVAGYRMGEHALSALGVPRGSFDLEVTHFTPREVQYSCIADGASAATGASVGKLNLSLVDAPAADTHTTYRRRSTGESLTLRVTRAFRERFANVPMPELAAAGRRVLTLRDDEIFERVEAERAAASR
jgi:formylmethanofuran dehydrogenase subunit E